MTASVATHAGSAIAARRPAATIAAVSPTPITPPYAGAPIHHLYRGTRGLAFVLLGFAGLGVLALGATTSQIVGAAELATVTPADRVAGATLVRTAPFVMLFGLAQMMSAVAVLGDRRAAMAAGLAMAVLGAVVALVLLLTIRAWAGSPFGTIPSTGPSSDVQGLLEWTIAIDLLAALSIRRIVRGRSRA